MAAELENTVINRTFQRISSFRSQQGASDEDTVIRRTFQRISRSQPAGREEPGTSVIRVTRSGRLIFVSLVVLLATVMWTGSAVNFCKGLWKSTST
ncbi:hypothetical protein ACP4OV_025416 [Aristida adscensionis]